MGFRLISGHFPEFSVYLCPNIFIIIFNRDCILNELQRYFGVRGLGDLIAEHEVKVFFVVVFVFFSDDLM